MGEEALQAVERERQDRIQELKAEGQERAETDTDIKHQLEAFRQQLDSVVKRSKEQSNWISTLPSSSEMEMVVASLEQQQAELDDVKRLYFASKEKANASIFF